MTELSRRQLIGATAITMSGAVSGPMAIAKNVASRDFWSDIALEYELDNRYTVLNGGGNNPLPRSVVAALVRYEQLAASQPRPFNYRLLGYRDRHRVRLAHLFGCDASELALTRNTTEGLNTVARGLELQSGDQVLISNYEERYALRAFEPLASRYGVDVVTVNLPVAPTAEEVVQAFAEKITPSTRLLAASHVVDSWGFVLPIKQLSQLAHDAGADMLVDGALAFGHMPVDVRELECDYYATSLHKWLNAPLGTGALYVRQNRISQLHPLYGVRNDSDDIRKYESIGTRDGSVVAAIGQAIDFYEQIGPLRKANRLRALFDELEQRLSDIPGVQVITEVDPKMRVGLGRVVVKGWAGKALTTTLREDHGFYVYGNFPGEFDGVYVSPNVFNSMQDINRFTQAIALIAKA